MLSEKPWRGEAVLRLLLGVIIFVMLGSLAAAAIGFFSQAKHGNPWLFGALVVSSALSSGIAFVLLRRRWDMDALTGRLGGFLLFLYVGLVLGMFALKYADTGIISYSAWRVAIAALSLQGAAVLLTIPFAREHGITWSEAFGFDHRWPRAILWGALVTIVFIPVGLGLQQLSMDTLNRLGQKTDSQVAIKALEASQGWPDRLALGVVAIVLAPFAEELIFRGILYPAIKRLGFPKLALWGTSLLFALIHANLPIFLPLLLLALALTVLYEKTDNLLAPILAHSLFNAINFAMFFLSDSFNQGLPAHS